MDTTEWQPIVSLNLSNRLNLQFEIFSQTRRSTSIWTNILDNYLHREQLDCFVLFSINVNVHHGWPNW